MCVNGSQTVLLGLALSYQLAITPYYRRDFFTILLFQDVLKLLCTIFMLVFLSFEYKTNCCTPACVFADIDNSNCGYRQLSISIFRIADINNSN